MDVNFIDLQFLRGCLKDAGHLAMEERARILAALGQPTMIQAAVKADRSPVTEVDHLVEDFLIDRVAGRYPGHQVLSEESGMHPKPGDITWVIDPIDGTRSFAGGLPIWGVSIGVLRAGLPECGGLYLPATGEMYWGTREQAFYNDVPLSAAQPADLESPLTFLAVPSNFYLHFDVTFPRARSLGSTAAHLAYTAAGAAAGALLTSISLWDIAGLLPVLAAVGMQVSTLGGKLLQPADLLDGRPIREPLLVTHPTLFEKLCATIHKKQPVR